MNQLNLSLDEALEAKVRALATEKNISLSEAAVLLMRKGAGLTVEAKGGVVGDSLDEFIGTWTQADEDEFLKTQTFFQTIDKDFW